MKSTPFSRNPWRVKAKKTPPFFEIRGPCSILVNTTILHDIGIEHGYQLPYEVGVPGVGYTRHTTDWLQTHRLVMLPFRCILGWFCVSWNFLLHLALPLHWPTLDQLENHINMLDWQFITVWTWHLTYDLDLQSACEFTGYTPQIDFALHKSVRTTPVPKLWHIAPNEGILKRAKGKACVQMLPNV